MIKTEVVWCGPERFIPNVGMANLGVSLMLTLEDAKSFVKQGLAKYPKPLKDKKEVK